MARMAETTRGLRRQIARLKGRGAKAMAVPAGPVLVRMLRDRFAVKFGAGVTMDARSMIGAPPLS